MTQASDAHAAVTGSTAGIKTLADDTLRVTIDIEPRHAEQAARMLLTRGTQVALAVLGEAQERPKSRLSQNAAMYCRDEKFRMWLSEEMAGTRPRQDLSEETAAQLVRTFCWVKSRSELDTDDAAARRWINLRRRYHDEVGT